jgi:hypothetical protein
MATNMTVGVGYFEGEYYWFTSENLQDLAYFMDAARVIVIQNHSFDLGVLAKYYPDRPGLMEWHRKVWDFYEACRSLFGCPYPLDSLSEFNHDVPPKLGASEDAPSLWRTGKIMELFHYCKRDVEILLQLFNKRAQLRIPVRNDTVTNKILGVATMNFLTGVVSSCQGTSGKKILELTDSKSLQPKCTICSQYITKVKYPTVSISHAISNISKKVQLSLELETVDDKTFYADAEANSAIATNQEVFTGFRHRAHTC